MIPLLTSDYFCVKAASGTSIVQTSTSWIDLGDAEDVVIYTDCKEAVNGGKLAFDTAATPLDSQFVSLVAPFTLATGLQTNVLLAAYASVAPLRYLRWRFVGPVGATSEATFRVLVAGYGWDVMSGRSYVLTEIVTLAGNNAPTDKVIQDATQWLDVNGAGDATIVVECFALTAPTGGSVVLNIQSSPFFDEITFALAAPQLTLVAASTPFVLKTVAAVSVAGLARFLRYAVTVTGTGSWSVTFRIRVVTNRSSYFRPTQLSGCMLWLRGDLGITLSGASVSAWADQSGSGHDASTSGASPTYAPTAVNGLSAIQGNGSTQAMKTVAFDAGSNATFITVVQPTTTNEGNTARIIEQNNVTSYYLGSTTGGTAYKLIVGDNTSPFGSAETTAGTVQQVPSIVSATYAAGSPHGVGTIYLNGASAATDSTSFTNPSGGSLPAFLMSSYFGTNFWSGYLAEVIVYQRVLSTTELLRVHRYLGGRYGVTVP